MDQNNCRHDYDQAAFEEGLELAYQKLAQDEIAWAEFQAEMAEWDATAGDGIE